MKKNIKIIGGIMFAASIWSAGWFYYYLGPNSITDLMKLYVSVCLSVSVLESSDSLIKKILFVIGGTILCWTVLSFAIVVGFYIW